MGLVVGAVGWTRIPTYICSSATALDEAWPEFAFKNLLTNDHFTRGWVLLIV